MSNRIKSLLESLGSVAKRGNLVSLMEFALLDEKDLNSIIGFLNSATETEINELRFVVHHMERMKRADLTGIDFYTTIEGQFLDQLRDHPPVLVLEMGDFKVQISDPFNDVYVGDTLRNQTDKFVVIANVTITQPTGTIKLGMSCTLTLEEKEKDLWLKMVKDELHKLLHDSTFTSGYLMVLSSDVAMLKSLSDKDRVYDYIRNVSAVYTQLHIRDHNVRGLKNEIALHISDGLKTSLAVNTVVDGDLVVFLRKIGEILPTVECIENAVRIRQAGASNLIIGEKDGGMYYLAVQNADYWHYHNIFDLAVKLQQ